MKNLSGENYKISHSKIDNRIIFDGTLRLRGLDEYQEISATLETCIEHNNNLIIDLTKLDFLNSSGIAMLSRFVITLRKKSDVTLNILGSSEIPWQGKSLKNLQRLMPSLNLTFK